MQNHIPPPEAAVVIPDLSQKQRGKDKTNGGQLKLRRDMNAEASFNQHRKKRDDDDHAGQESGEPALAKHGKNRLGQQDQLQNDGNSLMGNSEAHVRQVPVST